MSFFDGFNRQWFIDNFAIIVLGVAVFIQWIAIQVIAIHYHFFRQSLKKPTPDGIRFQTIEKVLSFQAGHLDRVFGKLAEMNKDITQVAERKQVERIKSHATQAPDSSFISMGEMNLKKRLNELKSSSIDTGIKSSKMN
ncbi:MAG: hypothetical protein JWQ35_1694 [Bacteriovoracaceae bacterium]|nr:hypothetical protein [Bacteriovoracaceae bacterium]